MAENKTLSFLGSLKKAASAQKTYLAQEETPPGMDVALCPNCGAGRAKHDGLTHCAYCGYQFIDTELGDGIYLKKEDNSPHV